MRRLGIRLLVWAILVLPLPLPAVGAQPGPCAAPDAYTTTPGWLGQLTSAVAAGGPVAILAVGSATTMGLTDNPATPATVAPGMSFPRHMLQVLQASLPQVSFSLTVRGGRGMTAADMLVPMQTALQEQHFPLVLWQTGTVEALRGIRPDALRDAVRTGTERVRQAGGDLVLIDAQYSRMLSANTDLEPYEAVLQQAATQPGVALFRRFDLTRSWATTGQIDLERTPKEQRDNALETLNTCLGEALAQFVLSAADIQKTAPQR
jgi:hypothetical protein